MFDLIIIGAGPAGITASVYAARKGMNFLVLSYDIGGQAAWSGDIENYPGYQFISGPELAVKFEEHMRGYKFELKEGEGAVELSKSADVITVKSNKGSLYEARTVIIASGKRTKELNVPGEKEFKNKGLTYCATCDAPLFSGKEVVVVGGGNSALDAALQLMHIARHIYLVNITGTLGGDSIMREKIEASPKVEIFNNSQVTRIFGDEFVKGVDLRLNGEARTLPVEGVFIEVGLMPNSEFAGIIEKNEFNEIKINCRNETNIPGIFAAGDVTNVPEKQIVIAAGEGSKASLGAFRYLSQHKFD